jgi:hypothetical protein
LKVQEEIKVAERAAKAAGKATQKAGQQVASGLASASGQADIKAKALQFATAGSSYASASYSLACTRLPRQSARSTSS